MSKIYKIHKKITLAYIYNQFTYNIFTIYNKFRLKTYLLTFNLQQMKQRYKSQPSVPMSQSIPLSFPQISIPQNKNTLKLPKIKGIKLSQQQIDQIGKKVIHIKKVCYGPMGCSRSLMMDKVLLLKRINRGIKRDMIVTGKQSRISKDRSKKQRSIQRSLEDRRYSQLTPEYYISKIYM